MTDTEEALVLTKLGEVTGELRGVQVSLQNGSKKMDTLLVLSQDNGNRIVALEQAREYMHKDCSAIHKAVQEGCVFTKLNENKNNKITMTFNNLMKLLGFIALIATCGMVAWNTTGGV